MEGRWGARWWTEALCLDAGQARHWGRIRSLSAISISLLLLGCQRSYKGSSLLDGAGGISRYTAQGELKKNEKNKKIRGASGHTRKRQWRGELLNAISGRWEGGGGGGWKGSALQRSLMYGLIWASTVATARLVGPGFTKLMAHIKTAEKFRFMLPTGPRGNPKIPFSSTSGWFPLFMHLLNRGQQFQWLSSLKEVGIFYSSPWCQLSKLLSKTIICFFYCWALMIAWQNPKRMEE